MEALPFVVATFLMRRMPGRHLTNGTSHFDVEMDDSSITILLPISFYAEVFSTDPFFWDDGANTTANLQLPRLSNPASGSAASPFSSGVSLFCLAIERIRRLFNFSKHHVQE